jgi:hypothetical protein
VYDVTEWRNLGPARRSATSACEHTGALRRECFRTRKADAARAASDDCELPEEPLHERQYTRLMRIAVGVVLGVALLVLTARAAGVSDDKALKPYAGKLVVSPDAPPSTLGELAGYLKINAAKDNHYELIKGPPWKFHLVSWFAKPATGALTVVITDLADKKATPMVSVEPTLSANKRLLYAVVEANASTGFETGKTYVVRMLQGKKLVAKAELLLRE